MRWWQHVAIVLGSLVLSALSVLTVFLNPFTLLFMNLAAPLVRLLGRSAALGGFSSLDSAIPISALWPLTLAPLYWVNYRLLKWRAWGYAGLFLMIGFLIAFVVLLIRSTALQG